MTKYIYESKGIECPECGEITHQLFSVKSKSGQDVLLCNACKPSEDKAKSWEQGWDRGGINE